MEKDLQEIAQRRTTELFIKFFLALGVLGAGIFGISYYANRYVLNPFPKNLEITPGQLTALSLEQVIYEDKVLNTEPAEGISLTTDRGLVVATSEDCTTDGGTPEQLLCKYHSAHYSNTANTWAEIFRGNLKTRNRETQQQEWPGKIDDKSLFLYFYEHGDKSEGFTKFFESQCVTEGEIKDYLIYEDREYGFLARTSYLPALTTKIEVFNENKDTFDTLSKGILDTHALAIGLTKIDCSNIRLK